MAALTPKIAIRAAALSIPVTCAIRTIMMLDEIEYSAQR